MRKEREERKGEIEREGGRGRGRKREKGREEDVAISLNNLVWESCDSTQPVAGSSH